jgi:hypothetical protein
MPTRLTHRCGSKRVPLDANRWRRDDDLAITAEKHGPTGELDGPRHSQPQLKIRSKDAPLACSARTACWVGVGSSSPLAGHACKKSLQIANGRTWDRTTDLPRVKRALSR